MLCDEYFLFLQFILQMKMSKRGIYSRIEVNTTSPFTYVQCFPLHSILLALDLQAVDFLSLDLSGIELDVLKTMPLKSINIETLSVSCDRCSDKNETDIIYYLKSNNYKLVTKIENYDMLSRDLIFIRKHSSAWSFCCCWFFLETNWIKTSYFLLILHQNNHYDTLTVFQSARTSLINILYIHVYSDFQSEQIQF